MSFVNTTTKAVLGIKAGKTTARHSGIVKNVGRAVAPVGKASFRVGKPLMNRQLRRRARRIADTTGLVLTSYGPLAAYALGLAEPPRQRRVTPWLGTGVVIGASAVYLLEPEQGGERRQRIAQLVS